MTDTDDRRGRLLGLELLRFAASVAVLLWHYQHFSYVGAVARDFVREKQPFYSVLRVFYEHGLFGVQVFWCISGFIFTWKYGEEVANGSISGSRFFVLRFSRLYPLHFATLIFVAVAQAYYVKHHGFAFVYQPNDSKHFVLQLFMASGWGFESGESFNGPIWSVSVEVLVYFCFFLAIRVATASAWLNVLIVGAGLGAMYLGLVSPVLDALTFFYLGGLVAHSFLRRRPINTSWLLLTIALSIVVLLPSRVPENLMSPTSFSAHLFLAVWTPALLFVALSIKVSNDTLQRMFAEAGNLTYAAYLIHFPLQLTLANLFAVRNATIPVYSPAFLLAYAALTLTVAYFVYSRFEVPCQRVIRQRFS